MTHEYFASLQSGIQPMMDIAEINRQTFAKLTTMQTDYLTDCFKANLEQFKVLTETQDPNHATELQFSYCKTMGDKLSDMTEQKVAAYSQAQVAILEAMQESCAHLPDMAFFKEISGAFFSQPTASEAAPVAKAPAKKAAAKKAS